MPPAVCEIRAVFCLWSREWPTLYSPIRAANRPSRLLFPQCHHHQSKRRIHGERTARAQPDSNPTTSVTSGGQRTVTSSSSIRPYATVDAASTSAAVETPSSLHLPPLSILPLSTVIRTLLTTTVSSSPFLLKPALGILAILTHSDSSILNPDRNLLLGYTLRKTLYRQFCAGEHQVEVQRRVQDLKDIGISGVILGYAKEVTVDEAEATALRHNNIAELKSKLDTEKAEKLASSQITSWKDGTLATVDMAGEGSFVNVKFTGAGKQVLQHMLCGLPPPPLLEGAIMEICERAKDRNVRLLFDAEQQAVQSTIDDWTMDIQRRYNRRTNSSNSAGNQRALIYNTYQAYLRSTPATIARHMAIADSEGFALGIKLVRGAYLGTEPRHLIWRRKEETDQTYNNLAKSLIKREYNGTLKRHSSSSSSSFPKVDLVLASHNRNSVQQAQDIRTRQNERGEKRIEIAYGQIFGMADDISCGLVHQGNIAQAKAIEMEDYTSMEKPKVYKAVVWGTVGECMEYLLRRGRENQDAASRTIDTRNAMAKELRRRAIGI